MRTVGRIDISNYGIFKDMENAGFLDAKAISDAVEDGLRTSIKDCINEPDDYGDIEIEMAQRAGDNFIDICLPFLGEQDVITPFRIRMSLKEVVRSNCRARSLREDFLKTLRKMEELASKLQFTSEDEDADLIPLDKKGKPLPKFAGTPTSMGWYYEHRIHEDPSKNAR